MKKYNISPFQTLSIIGIIVLILSSFSFFENKFGKPVKDKIVMVSLVLIFVGIIGANWHLITGIFKKDEVNPSDKVVTDL